MKNKKHMSSEFSRHGRGRVFLISLIALVAMSSPALALVAGSNYCISPPLIGSNLSPNLLMMIDNSASMYDLAHISSGTYCYDSSFDKTDTTSYEGYFLEKDQDGNPVYYRYYYGFFVPQSTLPTVDGANIYRTSYLWIQMRTETNGVRDVYEFYASGKFLNWLTASKFDIQKEILTGGKYQQSYTNSTCCLNSYMTNAMIGESRGCVGRRFVKEVPVGDWLYPAPSGTPPSVSLSFGVRGPYGTEPDLVNPSSQGGHTRIEIYEKDFNQSECQAAVDAWLSGNLGSWTTAAGNCLGISGGAGTTSGRELATFTETARNCYHIKENKKAIEAGATLNETNLMKNTSTNNLETQCKNAYTKDCNPNDILNCSVLNDEKRGNYICSKDRTHNAPSSPIFDFFGSDTSGFVGNCWDSATQDFDHTCVKREMLQYCEGYSTTEVVDPSAGELDTQLTGNAPAVLMDAGLRSAGDPIRPWECYDKYKSITPTADQIKTCNFFEALAALPAGSDTPSGIIQEFKKHIRMGAMTFNDIGSGSEPALPGSRTCSVTTTKMCSADSDCPAGETCKVDRDGSKIIHYVGQGKCSTTTAQKCTRDSNCPSGETCTGIADVGDHTAGLVRAIDDVQGTAWTPFSEAYYNSIGYFAPVKGRCSKTTGQTCTTDDDCPAATPAERCEPFGRTDLRLSGASDRSDFDERLHPSLYDCQKNFILLVTDGMSTADQNASVSGLANLYTAAGGETGWTSTCPKYAGSRNLDNLAWIAKNRKISTFSTSSASTELPVYKNDLIRTFAVYNGTACSAVDGTCDGECNPSTLLSNTAVNGGTSGLKTATNPDELKSALRSVFTEIASETVSGTAASVLASGEGSGANLIQAIFFPSKKFGTKQVEWIGRLSNYWYYVDPFFTNSNMREESSATNKILNLKTDATNQDNIFQFFFNETLATPAVNAHRWPDSNGDGVGETMLNPDVDYENLGTLWEAGTQLWSRTVTGTTGRATYTQTAGTRMDFTTTNKATLKPYLQAASDKESEAIIRYVRGEDTPFSPAIGGFTPTYRDRTVSMTVSGVTSTHVWKLGDILNSTPKISSWQPLNGYHKSYLDDTYGVAGKDSALGDTVDATRYTTTAKYKGRGMVFTGANDGMLHAFRLGTLQLSWTGQDQQFEKARLLDTVCSGNTAIGCVSDAQCSAISAGTCSGTVTLGEEAWAFIPKNALPYLRYLADGSYCHLYYTDMTPFIFDASVNKPGGCTETDTSKCSKTVDSWRTILIGGMRVGGACKRPGTCTSGNCVETPLADPVTANKGLGYSVYFALDITDQNNPVFLWEYDGTKLEGAAYNNKLGFSTSGPAVVRISAKNASNQVDQTLNGKWFVVFGSGPTGPIQNDSVTNKQFMGRSDQDLSIHVFDLWAGPGANNAIVTIIPTTIPEAFAGSMINATHDPDLDYQDDVVYIPYVTKDSSVSPATWTQGGVGRLLTREDSNPANWTWTNVIKNAGPVTSAVTRLMNTRTNTLWLFYGSGRYFYEVASSTDDPNPAMRRQLVGMKEPCLKADGTGFDAALCEDPATTLTFCSDPVSVATCGGLTNATDADTANALVSTDPAFKGWYINLDAAGDYASKTYHSEREITDPLATTSGLAYFTTYRPYDDPCTIGGKTFIWAVKYDTGGSPGTLLQGKALVQVSTGTIEQVDLATAFTEKGGSQSGTGRRTGGLEGVPPLAQGLSVISTAPSVRRVVHIKER